MQDNKLNTENVDGELKYIDGEKPGDNQSARFRGADFLKRESKLSEKGRGSINGIYKPKNKFPLALDIIIAVLALGLVVGLIFGAYYAFVYFSDDSDVVNSEYILLVEKDKVSELSKNRDVYIDEGDNTYYIGTISEISDSVLVDGSENDISYSIVKVRVSLEYRKGEGYSIYGQKIAVGRTLTLRTGIQVYDGTIVELTVAS